MHCEICMRPLWGQNGDISCFMFHEMWTFNEFFASIGLYYRQAEDEDISCLVKFIFGIYWRRKDEYIISCSYPNSNSYLAFMGTKGMTKPE